MLISASCRGHAGLTPYNDKRTLPHHMPDFAPKLLCEKTIFFAAVLI